MERRVRNAFEPLDPSGRMADECWRDVSAKVARWRDRRPQVEAFVADWPRHRAALGRLVAPPERLAVALLQAGAPATIAQLPHRAGPDVVRWALRSLPFMRDRFTVADLRLFSDGWPEAAADELLARSGILRVPRTAP